MRLHLILPRVEPNVFPALSQCPSPGCRGELLRLHQSVIKPLRDSTHHQVGAYRYRCLSCGRTFRVYPKGVSRAHTSLRLKGLAVLLYLLGLSYGAVSLALEALGIPLGKTAVYLAVQAAAARVPGLRRDEVLQRIKTQALGADVTSVKCAGRWLPLGLTVDAQQGLVLTLDALSWEDAQALKQWIEPVARAVEAEVLVSDDADAFKQVSDELGLDQQVCRAHVQRNTEALVEKLKLLVEEDSDGSLGALCLCPQQALADLERLKSLVQRPRVEDGQELEALHRRYMAARPPSPGEKFSVAYRLRLLFLDRWNLWPRLTYYLQWRSKEGDSLDGTNNATERAIGWWVKERYRTMRGYKRKVSAVNVSRLLAWAGNHLNQGANLALVVS